MSKKKEAPKSVRGFIDDFIGNLNKLKKDLPDEVHDRPRVSYMKPGDPEPQDREKDPFGMKRKYTKAGWKILDRAVKFGRDE